MRRLLACTLVAAIPVGLAAMPPAPFDLERDVASLMPAETMIYVEAPGFSELCARGLQHPLVVTLLKSPVGELIQEQIKLSPPMALGMLNLWAGRAVLPALAELTSGGVSVGFFPRDGKPAFCIAARGDAALWEEVLNEALVKVAESWELPEDKLVPPHRQIRGMDVWLLGETVTIAMKDGTFLASSDEQMLRRMIDLGASEEASSGLAAIARFHQARTEHRSEESFLWSWLDLDGLEGVEGYEMEDFRKVASMPGPQFLLGPVLSNLTTASEGVFDLRFSGDRIDLEVTGIGVDEGVLRSVLPPLDVSPPSLPSPSRDETARGVFYRDLTGLFRHRVELFPTDVQPAFAEATSNLALFFEGADITDEVLPGLEPWIGFVSRRPAFDERAVPDLPLPAAALLLEVKDPDVMGRRLVAAFQSFLAIINIQAAQNQQPALTLELTSHEGHTITFGRFRTPAADEGVDIRYNLVPACVTIGDTFVIGTHLSLVKELVSQITSGDVSAPSVTGDALSIRGGAVAEALRANVDALVMNAVLNEGKSEKVARNEANALIAVAGLIDSLDLVATRHGEDDLQLSLTMTLSDPEAE